ncbi:hypothetical protein [Hymenobacter mucosus]|uniref:Uncharacterized protein n=1 Tax=Hymenobacter mucosus TaxID=1411120 RepID=A0A238Y0R8_9BACT|nr:hypothetical protein [Hymenobacter mucosus]SNR64737.1 hypothetical protein SAMN06269173_104550 [Hymenobacter mucosus]
MQDQVNLIKEKAKFISDAEYARLVANWAQQEDNSEQLECFVEGDTFQVGGIISFSTISYLLSTPGIATIKIRFGLKNKEEKQFCLLLFGVDSAGERVTPYCEATSIYTPSTESEALDMPGEELPESLTGLWKYNWISRNGAVGAEVFSIRYGFLHGYNYSVQEFVATLGLAKEKLSVHIIYGLHHYYGLGNSQKASTLPCYAFGLVLHATKLGEANSIDDEGYYDLSSPCPRTC